MRRRINTIFTTLALVGVASAGWCAAPPEDERLLDVIQRKAMGYCWDQADPTTGLVLNTTEPNAPASTAACGACLSAVPIAVERGWMKKEDGYQYALRMLKTFSTSAESVHGFFYHYLDARTAQRTWHSEVSLIDASILFAGALTVAQYFPDTEVAQLANALYDRADWPWFLNDAGLLQWSYSPEDIAEGGSIDFSEGILAYLLGLGSATHPLPEASWRLLWRPVSQYAGETVVYAADGSLFTYVLPLAWFDLRDRHDEFMDYWTNAVHAIRANRQFALDQQAAFKTYRDGWWGLAAGLGPSGYHAYGGKPGVNFHDGTVAPYVVAASVPLVPELAWPTYQKMVTTAFAKVFEGGPYGLSDTLNVDRQYICEHYVALNQGLTWIMLENYRTGLLWRLFMSHPAARRALERAHFQPGAQELPTVPAVRRGNPGASMVITALAQPVKVDGVLDEWVGVPQLELTPTDLRNLDYGAIRDPHDASAYISVGHDGQRLYLAGLVLDDDTVVTHTGHDIYQDDCVEVFVDLDGDGFQFGRSPRDLQFGFSPTGPAHQPQRWFWGSLDREAEEMSLAVQRFERFYLFEAAVPLEMLGGLGGSTEPFRFAVSLHDRDQNGDTGKLIWSVDKETEPGKLMFGTATLAPLPSAVERAEEAIKP